MFAHAVAAAVEAVDITDANAVRAVDVALTINAVFLEDIVVSPVGPPGDQRKDEHDWDDLLQIEAQHQRVPMVWG